MKTLGPVAMAAAILLPQQQPPQKPPQTPVFRSGVSTVAVYATVTDFAGQLVRNLTKDDFHILDNGRLQELTVFSTDLQPITAVLLVDTSASMALTLDLARNAAEQFIIRMLPGDRARVGNFSDKINLGRPFSGDRDLLLKTFENELHIGNPTRLWDALAETMTVLSDVPGRRVALLLTDGLDTASTATGRRVIERAKEADVMIYAVQIRSKVRPDVEWDILGARTNQALRNQRREPPGIVLRDLAMETGGLYFTLNQNDDVNATFTEVATELHQQYLLGFTPQTSDGRVHELRVSVKHPLKIRARRSYLAPKTPR